MNNTLIIKQPNRTTTFNKNVQKIVDYLGCKLVQTYKSGAMQLNAIPINHIKARYILNHHNIGNRDLKNNESLRYAKYMISGKWHDNGIPLSFDQNGRLVDGQHRLMAIIHANSLKKPQEIEFPIFFKAEKWDCLSQDNSKGRTFSDYVKIANFDPNHPLKLDKKTEYSYLQGAISIIYKIKNNKYEFSQGLNDNDLLIKFYQDYCIEYESLNFRIIFKKLYFFP